MTQELAQKIIQNLVLIIANRHGCTATVTVTPKENAPKTTKEGA